MIWPLHRRSRKIKRHTSAKPFPRAAFLQLEELENRLTPSATLDGGTLSVLGTDQADVIRVTAAGANLEVTVNDETETFAAALVQRLQINGRQGNDDIKVDEDITVEATISGAGGKDTITGGGGNDTIRGGTGSDFLIGGEGDDVLRGRRGKDDVLGGDGDDQLVGGRNVDRLDGGNGDDALDGRQGDDSLFGGDDADSLTGGKGDDNFGPEDDSDTLEDFNDEDDEVIGLDAFRDSRLLGTRTFELPGAPDIDVSATGFAHQSGDIDYSAYTNPPTYGPHHPSPLPTGIYDTEEDDEDLVHNLEHGHVWISYRDDLLSDEDLEALTELVNAFGPNDGIIVTPRAANTTMIALASWGHLLTVTEFDAVQIRDFILTNRGYAHEGFATP